MARNKKYRLYEVSKMLGISINAAVGILHTYTKNPQRLLRSPLNFMQTVTEEEIALIREHMEDNRQNAVSPVPDGGSENEFAEAAPETGVSMEMPDDSGAEEDTAEEDTHTAAEDIPGKQEICADTEETEPACPPSDAREEGVPSPDDEDGGSQVEESGERLDNYSVYCGELSRGNREALLVHYVRTWFIAITRRTEGLEEDLTLDAFHAPEVAALDQDALSYILSGCCSAFSHIIGGMRETIVRENVMMPVQKVREIDSSGISWLCRRPGNTIREKLAGTRSLLAVQRRMSFDTGENRLLLAFARRAVSVSYEKADRAGAAVGTQVEEDFLRMAALLNACERVEEIRAWENTPPNNVLLSDRYYRQIWNAWNALNTLDELVAEDFEKLPERLTTLLYANIIGLLKKTFRFPQQPVSLRYQDCTFALPGGELRGLSPEGFDLKLRRQAVFLELEYQGRTVTAQMQGTTLRIGLRDMEASANKLPVCVDNFTTLAEAVCRAVGIETAKDIPGREPPPLRCADAVIDLFRVRPAVSLDQKEPVPLPFRLMGQRQTYGGKEFSLSCAGSAALCLDGTQAFYSIASAVRSGRRQEAARLAEILRSKLNARSLSFVFPDCYNEFDLSMLRTALRIHYRNIHTLPQSISALFYCAGDVAWAAQFPSGSFVLTVEFSFPQCTLTLVRGERAGALEYNGYDGLIWERFPSETIDLFQREAAQSDEGAKLDRFCALLENRHGLRDADGLLQTLGIDGLLELCRDIPYLCGGSWHAAGEDSSDFADGFRLDITDRIDAYREKMRHLIQGHPVSVVLTSPNILYGGSAPQYAVDHNGLTKGCLTHQNLLQQHMGRPLWRDHLPSLSIKRFVGSFDLVNDATITPVYHKRIPIRIENTFTLPKGQKSYHFKLIQGNASTRTQYAAVVEHKAFPLPEDTECRLHMSYCYGLDDPYILVFEPLHPELAGFREVKVKWTPIEEAACDGLPYPPFPRAKTWEELRRAPNRKHPERGTLDLIEWAVVSFHRLADDMTMPRASYRLRRPLLPQDWQTRPGTPSKWTHTFADIGEGSIRLKLLNTSFDDPKEIMQEIREISCAILEDQKQPVYHALKLSDFGAEWRTNKRGHYCIIRQRLAGKSRRIHFYESYFEKGMFSEDADLLTFTLEPREDRRTDVETICAGDYNFQWMTDRNGNLYCYREIRLKDGRTESVGFFQNQFVYQEDFPPSAAATMTFQLAQMKNGRYSARRIETGEIQEYTAKNIFPGKLLGCYLTKNVRVGKKPGFRSITGAKNVLFPLHMIFTNGRSLGEMDCPDELRTAVRRVIPVLTEAFHNRKQAYDERYVGHIAFIMLSLMAQNIGDSYELLAEEAIAGWLKGEHADDEIGYALGDLQSEWQQTLMQRIFLLPLDTVICILSKAAWRNERFILNADHSTILRLFDKAIILLSTLYLNTGSNVSQKLKKHTGRYIEFLLAVFRLRSLDNIDINRRLSLNNRFVGQLYQCAEVMYERKISIKTFLTFEMDTEGMASDMPPILYALLVCVTGESRGNEIIISGIDEEELEAEEEDGL